MWDEIIEAIFIALHLKDISKDDKRKKVSEKNQNDEGGKNV